MPVDTYCGVDNEDQLSDVADAVSAPTTMLIAGTVDPTEYALGLRLLAHAGSADDTAIIVTTTEGREQVIAHTRDGVVEDEVPSVAVVDTVSEDQYLTAPYADIPTVYMPSAGDLERVVIGLSDLTGTVVPSTGTRHFVIRSLTPLIEGATTERVCRLLERVKGLRVGDGLGIFGIDFTAHDEETMNELTAVVDRLLWVSEDSDGGLQFELRTTRRRL
ncbi:hypothetical protein M0R89_15320 [Halorussus limi]|uniref:Uncharacterized protein n=2 Tax=Halorussus TaxID=1070314 RepID=A0A8U0IIK7_9EURY|nr:MULTISPECIES: hypothetical protein [Halorussus]UPV73900.1 hypothetical protein M0R89_15320 [Halorussus limi]UPV99918.1 hypothetical protein M0R88_15540 [Halorussus gelatinilyticus]